MNNFLEFINGDIDGKKELISSLPTKTKTNIKKYNLTIESFLEKYNGYSDNLLKYISAKSKSIVKLDDIKDHTTSLDEIKKLERVKFLMNPVNTSLEKMGFDTLLYKINNYDTLNFKSLNTIINSFLDKFEEAGIILQDIEFDYTTYVNEYMTSFLEVRKSKSNDYSMLGQIFERIYWLNPELIQHIHLNFRKLIRKYSKKFDLYIESLINKENEINNIKNYNDCLAKINDVYFKYENSNKENVYDILKMSINGELNIEHYLPYNKFRLSAYQSLFKQNDEFEDKVKMKKNCDNLEKLKVNLLELMGYFKFLPMIDDFKIKYKILIDESDVSKKTLKKDITECLNEIIKKEKELDKINQKIKTGKSLFVKYSDNDLKNYKIDTVNIAKELTDLYKKYDDEYFKVKVLDKVSKNSTISDMFEIYYSFDYFKKSVIQKVFNLETYDEVMEYSNDFDSYVQNPLYMICRGILLFGNDNVEQVICNKYKLCGITIVDEDLAEDNIKILLDKINIVLRVNIVDDSNLSLDQINFVTKVEKFKNLKETKKA